MTALALLLAPWSLSAQEAKFDPATDAPERLFKVRPENAELLAAARTSHDRAAPLVKNIAEKRGTNQVAAIQPKEISDAYTSTLQFRRLAERLMMLAEPAGFDLHKRSFDFAAEIAMSIRLIRELPGRREKLSAALRGEFVPTAQKAAAKLGPISRLAQQGKWETAEQEFFELYDPLDAMSIWYEGNETLEHLKPFASALATIRDSVLAERRAAAQRQLVEARKASVPDLAALVKQVQDAALPLASSGKASVDGQDLAGPAALAALGRKWQAAQLAALRTRGLSWATQQVTATVQADLMPFEHAYNQAAGQMPAALAGLIDADAKRASPAEVPVLYAEYLAQLAPLVAISSDAALATAAEPALARLAARSPEFSGHVQAYRRATADALRWRRRVAQQGAARAMKTCPPLNGKVLEIARALNDAPGILTVDAASTSEARLQASSLRTMPGLAKLVGGSVGVTDVVGPQTAAGQANTRYAQRLYASFPSPAAALSAYVPLLEFDMLVSPAAGPMTLETAVALHRAKHGDVMAAGGQVTRLKLIGFIPHFTSLEPAGGLGALRLGPLPTEVVNGDISAQVLAEVEIKPAWVQHELMFVPTP